MLLMNKLHIALLVLCSFACQDKTICTLSGDIKTGRVSTISFQGNDTTFNITPDSNGHFSVTIPAQKIPFVTLAGVVEDENKWQFSTPVYLKAGTNIHMTMNFVNTKSEFKTKDDNNQALQNFREHSQEQNQNLWTTTPAPDSVEHFLSHFIEKAREINATLHLNKEVQEYITTWANIRYLSAVLNLKFIYSRIPDWEVPSNLKLPSIPQTCDIAYWKMFYDCPMHVSTYLNQHSRVPEEQLRLLQEQFKTLDLRIEVTNRIIENYLRNYSYSDENYSRLEKLTAELPNRENILKRYRAKQYSIIGAPIPDVSFEDKNGNKHKLSDFKGKYIYIDLWASWCSPCVGEVPYLQNLEKKLKNKNVVFVSISLDSHRSEWEQKMEQLKMHGNQWRATDDTFAGMLNVNGIPHFLIYGKDGRLLEYKTLRPSDSKILEKLESLH